MNDDLEIWRERLRVAQDKYMQASAIVARIQDDYTAQPQTADGEYALQQALRAEEKRAMSIWPSCRF